MMTSVWADICFATIALGAIGWALFINAMCTRRFYVKEAERWSIAYSDAFVRQVAAEREAEDWKSRCKAIHADISAVVNECRLPE